MTTIVRRDQEVNRDKWVAELESGNLGQTDSKLANEDWTAYCCLGVAADKIPDLGMKRLDGGEFSYGLQTDDSDKPSCSADTELPDSALEKLGMNHSMQSFLVGLNDDAKLNFYQIAQVIKTMPYVDDVLPDEQVFDVLNFVYRHRLLFTYAQASWLFERLSEAVNKIYEPVLVGR